MPFRFFIAGITASFLAACAAPTTTLIIPGRSVGDISADTTAADLIDRYGPDRVTATQVGLGEGYVCHGVEVAFDDDQALDVVWLDADAKDNVSEVTVRGDQWQTSEGVRLGLTLTELEAINGGPFNLSGFGWDYGGTVGTWDGGRLTETSPEGGNIMWIRFSPPRDRFSALSLDEQSAVSGDQIISSGHPVMQKLNPYISDLRVPFTDKGCDAFFAG